MTTEVQIGNCHSHLARLRTVVSMIGNGLGMSRREVEETEKAVSEICRRSIGATGERLECNLCVKLSTCDECMTVAITDPTIDTFSEGWTGGYLAGMLERIESLTDRVELLRESEGSTILITKYTGKSVPAAAGVPYAVLGTTGLRS